VAYALGGGVSGAGARETKMLTETGIGTTARCAPSWNVATVGGAIVGAQEVIAAQQSGATGV
jgi:hypothetical protein